MPSNDPPTHSDERPEPLDDERFEEVGDGDDAVIGRVFRRSLLVVGLVALIAVVALWLRNQGDDEAPEQVIETAAPEEVAVDVEIPPLPFTDITAAAGIEFVHENGAYGDKLLPETMGSGIAIFDYDNDDALDLFFVNSTAWPFAPASASNDRDATHRLYRNLGGDEPRFEDVTEQAGLAFASYGMGAAAADFDGDGWTDLFLTNVGGNRLLRNREGRFEDVTEQAGVAGPADAWSTAAAFFDGDGDGDLDLFVGSYVRWSKEIDFQLDFRLDGVGRAYGPPQDYEGSHSFYYRNEGDGRFTDASAASGIQVDNPVTGLPMAKTLGVYPVDVDRDGGMDLLVANDTVRNFFFHNQGGGTFAETGEFFGLAYDRQGNATGAMGVDGAYLRDTENLALAIGNFANEMSSLYIAQDDPTFYVDEAIGEGIGAPSRRYLSFGVLLFDADLDGRTDLLQVNGHLEEEIARVESSQTYRQPAQLFWHAPENAQATFLPVPGEQTGGLAAELVGRGAAHGDLDGDGDLDLVITQTGGAPLVLRNDQASGHHWLSVRLVDGGMNREAIGAALEIEAGGRTQRAQVMPTRSYLSQVPPVVTFGLGSTATVERLRVVWPDGTEELVEAPAVDQLLTVRRSP